MNALLSSVLIAVFLTASGFGQSNLLFVGRELTASGRERSLDERLKSGTKLAAEYEKIKPERSLLLYDCLENSLWCGDPAFSFKNVFSSAARADPDSAILAWYKSGAAAFPGSASLFTGKLGDWQGNSLANPPFQLLAIVNRMDLASWNGSQNSMSANGKPANAASANKWSGAEVRFVYGAKQVGSRTPEFTLILEFRLADFDWAGFQRLGRAWERVGRGDAQMLARLKDALAASGYSRSPFVRLRVNFFPESRVVWAMMQWDFLRHGTTGPATPTLTPLQDLVDLKYLQAAAGALPADYLKYLALWTVAPRKIGLAPDIDIPPGLLQKSNPKNYVKGEGMPTPVPLRLCGTSLPNRDTLALQQCNYCHTSETGTDFAQIANRLPGANAVLSPFLIGTGTVKPTIQQLQNAANSGIANPVTVNFLTYTGANCDLREVQPTTRRYHDLARRTLFLAALLASPRPGDPAFKEALALVRQFTTSMPH